MLLVGIAGTASAAPLGKNGKIYACYKVKGKPKGALRVVRGAKARCKRGERKVTWSAVASGESSGQGSQGQSGASGSAGASPSASEIALKSEVASLALKVDALEGVLQGITNEDLLGAVNAVPAVEALCEQAPALAEQVNLVQDVIGGLGLEPALELIGLLEIPALPTELEVSDFGCSVP